MKRALRQVYYTAIVLVVLGCVMAFIPRSNKLYVSDYENVLGTSMEIKIAASGEHHASKAEEAALKEIAALCLFPDIASFSKAYKKCFNISPSMFRR